MKFAAPGLSAVLLLSWVFATTALADPAQDNAALAAAIAGPQRTPAFKARDGVRHPLQTLEFFGVQPNMTLVEVIPGGGWWTEILAPYLKQHGHLVEATAPISVSGAFMHKMAAAFAQKLQSDSGVYGGVALTPFEPPDYMPLGAPGSADMVVTFDNMHDLVYLNVHGEMTDLVLQNFFRSAYQVLKPGGVLGVVEHRAPAGAKVQDVVKEGRLPQNYLIAEAEKAGFSLGGASELNANPRDTGQYPVWDLPPSLEQGAKDRAKLEAIGESDAMTLKFIKPKA